MERNQVIGIILIMTTFLLWTITSAPPEVKEAGTNPPADSLAINKIVPPNSTIDTLSTEIPTSDSTISPAALVQFGPFAAASKGTEESQVLENELVKITFSSKGGVIKEVFLKKHVHTLTDSAGNETKAPVTLLSSPENSFSYGLPVAGTSTGIVQTQQLFFTARKEENSLIFRVNAGQNQWFEQKYTLAPDDYTLGYSVNTQGMSNILTPGTKSLTLSWKNHLQKYEKGEKFEQNYSTVYFKEKNESRDYCSCVSDDTKELAGKPIEWVTHTNQFFNTSLMAMGGNFLGVVAQTEMTDTKTSPYVKIATSEIQIPLPNAGSTNFEMKLYSGPNEYSRLTAFNNHIEEIIPFGSSIFGTINRYVIRPFFDFLSQHIGSKGIVIILLIFLIKMLLYPLMYKMLHSQAKMGALKPELAHLKEKHKDDLQKQQMETMKIYREYGVNPLGGCLPMLLQMPIWYALFRFFPASITFRQEPFLWATDLSSYDVLFMMGFEIPYFGAHVSLFTLLWAVSTIVYSYYNMQNMDFSANPAMKYMQYIMPVLFLAFFNNYASGLTCYMFFSNLINILQTIVTKNYIFDEAKIREELLKTKAKPKKKSGFASRLEEAMKQQQALQEQRKKK
ncbi:MAG: membrane protein insertase YidC [Saprospiraceae bacterium]|nr:membrane protein insertase YidC [Saprospiraceae bacterium]